MPDDLVEGYGCPQVTDEVKAKIPGGNIARMHGLDIEDRKRAIATDEWSTLGSEKKAAPWSGLRSRLQREAA